MGNYNVLVSATKWITLKFPVQAVAPLYARMQANKIFTIAESSQTFLFEGVALFYVNGNYILQEDAAAKTEKYGFNLYLSRVFLGRE